MASLPSPAASLSGASSTSSSGLSTGAVVGIAVGGAALLAAVAAGALLYLRRQRGSGARSAAVPGSVEEAPKDVGEDETPVSIAVRVT